MKKLKKVSSKFKNRVIPNKKMNFRSLMILISFTMMLKKQSNKFKKKEIPYKIKKKQLKKQSNKMIPN